MKISFGGKTLGKANTIRIKPMDWLLIIGFCFAPMTGLRVWKVGPAEIICLVWSLWTFTNSKLLVSSILKFFIGYLTAMLIGSIAGFFIARNELYLSGLLTWFYLAFIAVMVFQGLSKNSLEYNEKLFNTYVVMTTVWQIFLYVYSITVSTRFLGAPLWYSSIRYSGGGTNPHQVAVFLCGATFVFLRNVAHKKQVLLSLFLAIASVLLMIQTASSTGVIALVFGAMSMGLLAIANIGNKLKRGIILFISIVAVALIVLLTYRYIYDYVYAWIQDDPNGEGRLTIFASIGNAFKKDPIFGLGPGIHALDGRIEFHNTYLEILSATGLVGFGFFAVYTVQLFRQLWAADWTLLPPIIAVYAYGIAGFSMRRLVYWSIVMFAAAIAKGIIKEQQPYYQNRIGPANTGANGRMLWKEG